MGQKRVLGSWIAYSQGGEIMESSGASSVPDGGARLGPPPRGQYHDGMGSLASATGGLVFLFTIYAIPAWQQVYALSKKLKSLKSVNMRHRVSACHCLCGTFIKVYFEHDFFFNLCSGLI